MRSPKPHRQFSAPAAMEGEGFEDVVPGEGGEPAPVDDGTGDGGGYSYDPEDDGLGSSESGSTAGVATLNVEVAILSVAAVDLIAKEIARKVEKVAKTHAIKGIVLATPDLLAVLRLRASLVSELDSLEASVAAAPVLPPGGDGEAAAFAVPAAALALQGVKQAAKSASSALSVFGVTTRYSGRKDTVRQVTLDAALAKHLSGALEVRMPLYALPAPDERGFIARALKLQQLCRRVTQAGSAGPEVTAASQTVDAIVSAIFGAGGDAHAGGGASAKLAQQMMIADSIVAAGEDGFATLFSQLTVTGGSYRTRRWVFNFLTGSDGLSYSAGAAATYFLFHGDRQDALASDTIYYASAHERFEQPATRHRATNIES